MKRVPTVKMLRGGCAVFARLHHAVQVRYAPVEIRRHVVVGFRPMKTLLSSLFVLSLTACGASSPSASTPEGASAAACGGGACSAKPGECGCKKEECACGGGEAGACEMHKHGGGGHEGHGEGGHGDHHANLSPALHELHEVLAPVWHSEPGAVRVEKTCAAAASLNEKAQATADAELVANFAAVTAACAAPGRTDVEARLGVAHDRFHALAK